ncbi:MAG TPA: phosphoglycerate kinase [Candidatus Paceibacterota bacterium]|jgi:3-phosphoglycerate kinase|nr:phosphoglycerate kinase [Candidatus Paceibacterota bacterium]
MKTLNDIPHLSGVKVLVRVDFNVPIKNGVITDDYRIRKAIPTIDFLKSKGARLVLISHIETAEGLVTDQSEEPSLIKKPTLAPVAEYLKRKDMPVTFVKNISAAFDASEQLSDGEMILVENIRENEGEKTNDKKFAKQLATLADIYVNDAFSVSHREHASVCAIAQFLPSYAGIQLQKEVENLSSAFNPAHPFLFVLGGAKFDTKLPLIHKFLASADKIFIGGALANDALKAKGFNIGMSKTSNGKMDITPIISQHQIMMPIDVVIQDHSNKKVGNVSNMDAIYDIGTDSLAELKVKINEARFILWNGPLGLFEKGFIDGTVKLAQMIAERTQAGATSMVGGGDTLSAISKLGIEDKFSFVSTGGGAMLDFLAQGTLPGIEALKNSDK